MKLRKFVAYIWAFCFLLFASFGSFYIITGENLLTGQKREGIPNDKVLNASDINQTPYEDASNLVEGGVLAEKNQSLLLFQEVMNQTTDKSSLRLDPVNTGEAAIFFRFGNRGEKYYIAVFAEGLEPSENYYAWLIGDSGFLKIGNLKVIDDTTGHKLSLIVEEDLSEYSLAAITLEGVDEVPTEPLEENYLYSAEFDSSSLFEGDSEITPKPSEEVSSDLDTYY